MAKSRCLPETDSVRRNGQAVNQNGFSDHLPITITVTEAVGSRNNFGGTRTLASHLRAVWDAVNGAGDGYS